jgi:hypothetical protein
MVFLEAVVGRETPLVHFAYMYGDNEDQVYESEWCKDVLGSQWVRRFYNNVKKT